MSTIRQQVLAQAEKSGAVNLPYKPVAEFEQTYGVAIDTIYHSQNQTVSERLPHTIGVRITVNL